MVHEIQKYICRAARHTRTHRCSAVLEELVVHRRVEVHLQLQLRVRANPGLQLKFVYNTTRMHCV